jgi:hypothetical protein
VKHDRGYTANLSKRDVNRWMRATEAMRNEPEKYKLFDDNLRFPQNCLRKRSQNFRDISFNNRDFRSTVAGEPVDNPFFWLMVIGLPILYGSIHLAAWNFEFLTQVERIMWRVACLTIASGVFVCITLSFAITLSIDLLEGRNRFVSWLADFLDTSFPYLVFCGESVTFLSSRLFVIVESFISVRRLPLGIFITVEWSDYIPHL